MAYDLSDVSTFACWTRLNETPEEIAHMTMTFMEEFSSRVAVGRWTSLDDDWDRAEEDLVRVIEKYVIRDSDNEPSPEEGYHFSLPGLDGPLRTTISVAAGGSELSERVASPSFSQDFFLVGSGHCR